MVKYIESKSGLSKKERHLLQLGFEANENSISTMDEFYIYQNKTRKKIMPTITDVYLILKYKQEHFDLQDDLIANHEILTSIRDMINNFLDEESEIINQLNKNNKA